MLCQREALLKTTRGRFVIPMIALQICTTQSVTQLGHMDKNGANEKALMRKFVRRAGVRADAYGEFHHSLGR
jgi:hypothetical protein